jgi:hypothetical protein
MSRKTVKWIVMDLIEQPRPTLAWVEAFDARGAQDAYLRLAGIDPDDYPPAWREHSLPVYRNPIGGNRVLDHECVERPAATS